MKVKTICKNTLEPKQRNPAGGNINIKSKKIIIYQQITENIPFSIILLKKIYFLTENVGN